MRGRRGGERGGTTSKRYTHIIQHSLTVRFPTQAYIHMHIEAYNRVAGLIEYHTNRYECMHTQPTWFFLFLKKLCWSLAICQMFMASRVQAVWKW